MLEISERQKIVLRQMNQLIDEYCSQLKTSGTPFDKELIHGIVNRLISVQLEKTVAMDRQRHPSLSKNASLKHNGKSQGPQVPQVAFLKPRSEAPVKVAAALPKPKNFKRALSKKVVPPPPKVESSPKVNNSRMNLLTALKKAREESATKAKEEDEEKASEDTGSELSFSDLKPDTEIQLVPFEDAEPESDIQFIGTVEYIPATESRRKRKTAQPILIDADVVPDKQANVLDISNESESSGKSSRRSSDTEDAPKQETEARELGQARYLRYFNLLTHGELKEYQSRRTSRRKRNCTSTNRKDFHYGSYDIDYQPVRIHSNKPMLFTPSTARSKRKAPMDPLALPEPPQQIAKRTRLQVAPPPKMVKPTLRDSLMMRRSQKQASPSRDLKPCITCNRLEDSEKMNACLICYNFYHLTCHTLQRELRERENMCPGCLKRIVDKRKRQLEVKKMLKVQVLQAQHKARLMQAKHMPQKA